MQLLMVATLLMAAGSIMDLVVLKDIKQLSNVLHSEIETVLESKDAESIEIPDLFRWNSLALYLSVFGFDG